MKIISDNIRLVSLLCLITVTAAPVCRKAPDGNHTGGKELTPSASVETIIKRNVEILKESAGICEHVTLPCLKEKYGRIDVVTLFTGRVIKGVIISRGNSFSIITPDGVISVDASKIMKTGKIL